MINVYFFTQSLFVALRARAWIEIRDMGVEVLALPVALRARAWIEISVPLKMLS